MSVRFEPQPTVADLSALVPTISPISDADPEHVAVGERYWALAGFDKDRRTPLWRENVADIDTSEWGNQLYAVAGAGVHAVVPGLTCPSCEGPLRLTSRAVFQELCSGKRASKCADCTASFPRAVRAVLDPSRRAARRTAQEMNRVQQELGQARSRWVELQRQIIAKTFAHATEPQHQTPALTDMRDAVAALALVRYAPSTTPIDDIGSWPDPWHPKLTAMVDLLDNLVEADLIRIDPSSPVEAFLWEPKTFDDALDDAADEAGAVAEPELTGSWYPLETRFYIPGPGGRDSGEHMAAELTAALNPSGMTVHGHDRLLAVARELIAEEALRYLDHRLEQVRLPAVPDNSKSRAVEAISELAELRSLGQIYNLIWQATRAAAEAAQSNPRAPRTNMTTHAVNRLESSAQKAVSEPDWQIKPFNAISHLGLSAMTRTLFYNVFDCDPVGTSIPEITATLPTPVPDTPPAETDTSVPVGSRDDPAARIRLSSAAAGEYIHQEATLLEPRSDGTIVPVETSAAAWTLAHKGYSGSGRLDVRIYPSEQHALRAGAELAIEYDLGESADQGHTLFVAAEYAQVLKLYEKAHPGNLLRVQPSFFVPE